MRTTDRRRNSSGLAWLIFAAFGLIAVIRAGFPAAGVQYRQVVARPNGIGASSLARSRRVQSLETAASTSAQEKFFSLLRIEDTEETLPQLLIQGKEFTVVIRKQRLEWPAEARHRFDADGDETARSFEVRDAMGTTVYKQRIEDPAGESEVAEIRKLGRFAFTEAVYASRMQGARNQALVIGWASLPSAPDSCATHVVLGLFDGKLVPFSEPFCEDIVSSGFDAPDRTWKLKKNPGTDFETFEIRRGYGFFHVLIPIRVDFLMAGLFPARWCVRLGAPALLADHCEFPVETERIAAKEDTFVRLFPSADETATPRHVVVRPDARIEFLTALAPNALDRRGKWKDDKSAEIPWLKVRIDGKEGWVHAAEDLNALGVPPENSIRAGINTAVLSTLASWTLGNELPLPGNPGNSLSRPAAKGRPGWRIRRRLVEDCDGPVRYPLNPIREG